MVQSAENSADLRISSASLDGDGALSDGRHANIGGKYLADALAPAQAVEPRFSDYDGVVFAAFNFAKTRVHIAAQVPYVKIRPRVGQLGLPPQAAGADTRTFAQGLQGRAAGGHQTVAHVFTAADRRKEQARGRIRRDIFHAVDGEVNRTFEERFFQFFDEDSLPADLRKRGVLQFVTGRLDENDFGFHIGDVKKLFADELGLPFGE